MNAQQTPSSTDNWSSILSDLGFDSPAPEKTEPAVESVRHEPVAEKIPPVITTPAAPEPKTVAAQEQEIETTESVKPAEPKKRFFDRFPKIDLFGSKGNKGKSLEAVVESVRSPSLSGKSFTSHTIEKVPVSPERVSKRNKEEAEKRTAEAQEERPVRDNRNEDKPVSAPLSIDVNDPWSQVAAQVGVLSVEESQEKKRPPQRQKRQPDNNRPPRDRDNRKPDAAFDPLPETDEAAALSSLMEGWDNDSRFDKEAEKRLHSILGDERKEETPFGFERAESEPEIAPRRPRREERDTNRDAGSEPQARRGGRTREPFRDDNRKEREEYVPTERQPRAEGRRMDSRPQPTDGRRRTEESFDRREEEFDGRNDRPVAGRRGSRYQRDESRTVEEPVLDRPQREHRPRRDEGQPERQERGGRGRRMESAYEESAPRAESSVDAASFKGVPSWDEAISALIEKNSTQRSGSYRRR